MYNYKSIVAKAITAQCMIDKVQNKLQMIGKGINFDRVHYITKGEIETQTFSSYIGDDESAYKDKVESLRDLVGKNKRVLLLNTPIISGNMELLAHIFNITTVVIDTRKVAKLDTLLLYSSQIETVIYTGKTEAKQYFNTDYNDLFGILSETASLKDVYMPSNTVMLDNYIFYECISLEHINIPDTVIRMGIDTFSYCKDSIKIDIRSTDEFGDKHLRRYGLDKNKRIDWNHGKTIV